MYDGDGPRWRWADGWARGWGRIRFVAVTVVLVLTAALPACSDATESSRDQAQPSGFEAGSIWVADEGADSLTVLDAATNTVVTTVKGVQKPHNVQVGRDGVSAYAVSGATNQVVAIDAATYTIKGVASTGPAPAHVIEAPNGKVDEIAVGAEHHPKIGEMDLLGQQVPLHRFTNMVPMQGATGAFDELPMLAGEGVCLVRDLPPAGEVVARMAAEARQRLSKFA